ncbi:MAG: MMPL family transporter, partial [Planctomycetaceae bacterium]|nr:MMPL family transporter [Planctomycetaceae bacterium]
LSPEASDRITGLADQLNQIQGVAAEKTRHLVNLLEKAPSSRNTRAGMLRLFEGILIGQDETTTAIVLELLPESEAMATRSQTIDQIRRVAGDFDAKAAVAGEPVQIFDMFDLVEKDGHTLYLFTVLVLSCVLLIIFRGFRWVFAPIGIVVSSVILTRAALVLSGAKLSMVSSMLNSLVTVISIATTMHVIVHFREHRRVLDVRRAAVATLEELRSPVFWALTTTAVGFGSLLISDIVPVRSFSVMMISGTTMVFVCTFASVPAMMASGRHVETPGRAPLEHRLDQVLNRLAHMVDRHPLWAAMTCLVLVLATAPGLTRLTVETDFSKNFRESSSIVQSLKFVESNLGGAGTWEVAFDVPTELSTDFLKSVRSLTDKLHELRQAGIDVSVLSLSDAIDLPPRLGNEVTRLKRLRSRQSDLVAAFYNETAGRMRILLRSVEQQSAEEKLKQIDQVRAVIRRHFAELSENSFADSNNAGAGADGAKASSEINHFGGHTEATASGLFVLLARIIESLLADQLKSFLVASFGILISMTIAFRSLRIGLISILPNAFPVVIVIGTLGMLGIPINIGTAMIASVSMGLTVDSTIHYIAAFERARRENSIQQSLQIAHAGAGRALVLAYLALMLGFLVLTVSSFIPLIYFGALLSLSMAGGMVGDLVLLPLLLRWTTPASRKHSVSTTGEQELHPEESQN